MPGCPSPGARSPHPRPKAGVRGLETHSLQAGSRHHVRVPTLTHPRVSVPQPKPLSGEAGRALQAADRRRK